MHSRKPGLGPSLLGGIGGIAVTVLGVLWMAAAQSSDAPLVAVFGVGFVALGIGSVAYAFFRR